MTDPAATTLYLSGPMSGWEDNNYPLFNEVAAILRGLVPIGAKP